MVLLWNMHVQEPIHTIHISLRRGNFFRKDVDRYYIWPAIDLSVVSSMTAKDNHATSRQAKNRGHFLISRRVNKEIKLGGVPVQVVLYKFLFGSEPVLEVKAMYATTPLEKLVSTLRDCGPNDLLV